MGAAAMAGQFRWIAAAGVAGTIAVLFLLLLGQAKVEAPALSPPLAAVGPRVKIARPDESDVLLKEEAELRDLRPLFLPTGRNASLPEPRLAPGRSILDREALQAEAATGEPQLVVGLPPVATIGGATAAEARPSLAFGADATEPGLIGFGRRDEAPRRFEPRGGFLEVTAWNDGRRVKAESLPVSARPPGERDWSPLEFLAVVDRAGLAVPLVVTEGSRVEEVDLHFKSYLTTTLRVGERLEPGTYRIVVAP